MDKKKVFVYSIVSFILFISFVTAIQLPILLNSSAKDINRKNTTQDITNKKSLIKKSLSNRIVLKLKDVSKKSAETLITNGDIRNTLDQIGATNITTINMGLANNSAYIRISVPHETNIKKTLEMLKKNALVEFAEPDYVYSSTNHSQDPYYIDQKPPALIRSLLEGNGKWNPPFDIQWNLRTISAPHNLPINDPSIIVAVIDTGVDYMHAELSDHIWKNSNEIARNGIDDDKNGFIDDIRGWDAVTFDFIPEGETDPKYRFVKTADNDPMDDARENFFSYYYAPSTVGGGHGTHVAGIISGSNNGYGFIGVNPGITIMPLRAINAQGYGSTSDIAQMISYAVSNNAKVINLSLGGADDSAIMREAINYADRMGVVVVAAVPNGESVINPPLTNFPSDYESVIAVASTKPDNTQKNRYEGKTDVAAPGEDILSARAKDTDQACISDSSCSRGNSKNTLNVVGENKEYYIMPGTSTASPHVAGLASLILSKWPSYTPAQVKRAIFDNVDYKVYKYGSLVKEYGIINIDHSLNSPKPTPTPYATYKKWKLTFNPVCLNNQTAWDNNSYLRTTSESIRNNGERYSKTEILSKRIGEKKTFEISSPDIDTPINITAWSGYGNSVNQNSLKTLPNDKMQYIENGKSILWNAKDLPSGEYVFNFQAEDQYSCRPFMWSIQTEVVCKSGTYSTNDETQPMYMVWPPGSQEWKLSTFSKTRKQVLIISATPPLSKIYVALRTKENKYLEPSSTVLRDNESFSTASEYIRVTNFGSNPKYPVLEWYANDSIERRLRKESAIQRDGFIEKLFFQFYAPDAWCK